MRLSHDPPKISGCFDDPNLVSRAGLVPVMGLAERAGLAALIRDYVHITARAWVFAEAKIGCLVAGMAAGADSIDDMNVLRHGAMPELFEGVRAAAGATVADQSSSLILTCRAFVTATPPR
jgi:hypothetical protein